MSIPRIRRAYSAAALVLLLAACGKTGDTFSAAPQTVPTNTGSQQLYRGGPAAKPTGKLQDLFSGASNPNTTVRVNKYIWNAALDVLDFLPIRSVDPFTGVIVTGYGTPPGGRRAYRATIYVQDPALDARSLNIAMETRGGRPVSTATVRAIEDAILTRARQLRIEDGKL
jgi:hypothetical protein